jgi:hypothetical protein
MQGSGILPLFGEIDRVQVSAPAGENGHCGMVRWMALLLALGNLKLCR